MAYSAVSTVTDGSVFSASQLNGLISNQTHFQTIVGETSTPPFLVSDTSLDANYGPWLFRYQKRYLHYYIEMLSGDMDRLKINVNGNDEFNDGVNRGAGYIYSGYIDITGITSVPTAGDYYLAIVNAEHLSPSGGSARIWYLLQSDNTSL